MGSDQQTKALTIHTARSVVVGSRWDGFLSMADVTTPYHVSIVVAVSKFSFALQQLMDASVVEWLEIKPEATERYGHPHMDGKLLRS